MELWARGLLFKGSFTGNYPVPSKGFGGDMSSE